MGITWWWIDSISPTALMRAQRESSSALNCWTTCSQRHGACMSHDARRASA